ncbi:MAG: hypothetical protein AB1442_04000 [Nitrospirota bacterium]
MRYQRSVFCAVFLSLFVMMPLNVFAGTWFQSDENAPVVEGTTARTNFQSAAGALNQVNFESFGDGAVLTGNEFSASGVTFSAGTLGGDTDDVDSLFPGFTRGLTVQSDGTLRVISSTGVSEGSNLEITFNPPVRAAGFTVGLDPEGGDNRVMEVYSPGNVLLDTSPLEIFDDSDNLQSAFVGFVGNPGELIERVVIGNDDDGMVISSFEFSQTAASSVAVPTMTEWGMILFMFIAGLASVYYLRRRRRLGN